jgi:16S rRNA processing protein RimM
LQSFIAVGKIRKPFALKGYTYIEPLTLDVNRFFDIKECFVGLNEKSLIPLVIESVEPKGDKLTIKFEEYSDRSGIEKLTNFYIYIDEKDSIKLPANQYFMHQLIGLQVKDEKENDLGYIKNIIELPAHNLFVIEYKNREVLVPHVDEFVISIDLASKLIVLNVIEGLFD